MKHGICIIWILVSGILCLSCNDWLDVSPSTEKDKEDILSNQAGFRSALIGAYIRMKSSGLYGKEMTWGVVENLAQHWDFEKNSVGEFLNKYDYKAALVESTMATLYNNLYKVIADVNSILEVIDKEKGVFAPGEYELIKGEATAIRAFCHFDVLRLFGPIPGKLPSGKVLPYVTTVSLVPNQHRTYEEYTRMLVADLDTAERNLGKVDLIRKYSIQELNQSVPQTYGADDVFWGYRQMRMNYYAVLAEKARVYLWLQDKSKALEYAREVIDAKDKAGKNMYSLGTMKDVALFDYCFSSEHILCLDIFNMSTAVNMKTAYHKSKMDLVADLFPNSSTDIRLIKWWEENIESDVHKNQLKKYVQEKNVPRVAKTSLPLIRLYEMYLIAMECGTLEEAASLYREMAITRDFEYTGRLDSKDELNRVLIDEYNREFYGEGQAFYAYKRLGWKNIHWTSVKGGIDTYVIPLPKQELSY